MSTLVLILTSPWPQWALLLAAIITWFLAQPRIRHGERDRHFVFLSDDLTQRREISFDEFTQLPEQERHRLLADKEFYRWHQRELHRAASELFAFYQTRLGRIVIRMRQDRNKLRI